MPAASDATTIEFSLRGYRTLLEIAADLGYAAGPVREMAAAGADDSGKKLILRHDIDFSLDCALALAALEHDMGRRATYFILPTADFYNPFDARGREIVGQIEALGHEIGLHWDSTFAAADAARGAFAAQKELLGLVAGHDIRSASQHIPTDSPAYDIAGLIEFDVYSEPLMKRFKYISDSSMVWRQDPVAVMESGADIQMLTHPVWWASPGETQDDKLTHALADYAAAKNGECAEMLDYLHRVLAEREKYDDAFREKFGG